MAFTAPTLAEVVKEMLRAVACVCVNYGLQARADETLGFTPTLSKADAERCERTADECYMAALRVAARYDSESQDELRWIEAAPTEAEK